MMQSLLQLPQNIWRDNVLSFLPKIEEVVRLDSAVANRSDRDVFHSNINGSKRFSSFSNKAGKIKWFARRNLIAQRVCFTEELQLDDVPHLEQFLAQVQSIYFQKNSVSVLSETILRPTTLIRLNFMSCAVADLSPIAACHNLSLLTLCRCPNITNESFIVGIQGCGKMTHFYLHECVNLREEAIVALLRACLQLENLTWSGHCDLSEVAAQVTAPSVTCFTNTDKLSSLSGSVLRAIATLMPGLASMDIQYASNTLGDNDIDYLVRNCSNLKSIHWDKYPHVTNVSLTSAALHLRGLIEVYISHCPGISDSGVTALARTAENLHTLHLTALATLTDAAIQTVGTLCRLLKDLTVRNCNLITDSAFNTLNMSKIIDLDVSGTRVTGTFATHVFSATSALQSFYAIHCKQLTSVFAHSITRPTKLLNLWISYVRLSESDWMQLSAKFPNLEMLDIRNVLEVNDNVMHSFKAHCPSLRYVTIVGCNVSEEVLQLFKGNKYV